MSSNSLSTPQREAVRHVEGPLLVLAGPGSGKTRVVTHRIAHLLRSGVASRHVLAVTFTNRAAREMRQRVRALVSRAAASELTVSTFHAACVAILREDIGALGYGRNFTIYDEASQHALARTVLRDLSGRGRTGSASTVLDAVACLKAGSAPEGAADEASRFLQMAAGRYREELRARNAVDFDDIILLTLQLLREHEDVLERWRDRHRFISVDEYQDTNAVQEEVLTLLAGERRNLCAVGDDDQGIYSWRGADVRHVLGFARRHPGARIVRLGENYRSTARIVALARAVIEPLPDRHQKELFTRRGPGAPVGWVELEDEEEEADHVVSRIAAELPDEPAARARAAARYAILVRTNELMRPFEQALRRSEVPHRLLGGRSFFDRKEVLDVLAYLRVALNPDDEEALLRVLNVPARGLGARSLEAVRRLAAGRSLRCWDVLEEAADARDRPFGLFAEEGAPEPAPLDGLDSRAALSGIGLFVDVIRELRASVALASPSLFADLLESVGYRQEVDRTYSDERVRASRWELAQEVQRAWDAYRRSASKPSPGEFLDAVTLDRRDEDDGPRGVGVTLATVHASKGLEFPVVHVAGLEEGLLPHAKCLDDGPSLGEERRLLYVAATRAQDELVLSRARTRSQRGKSAETTVSRFVQEIGPDLLESVVPDEPASAGSVAEHLGRLRAIADADD